MKLRLDRILSNMGWGTRNEVKKLVKQRLVTVDGETVTDLSLKIDPEQQAIYVGEERVSYRKYIYLMMNKPAGYISATEDDRFSTVLDLLSEEYRIFSPFPVGRLDRDTEGLLIITNDGQFAHNLTAPRKHVAKKYYALVRGKVSYEDGDAFSEGVVLDDGYKTLPGQLNIINVDEDNSESEVELVIYEGKFHQVKRMFQSRGKEVIYLKRLSVGNLKLDKNLALGEYRELTGDELKQLSYSDSN
jgi:16S rRNA pseudouridine516 synthase